MSFFPGAAATLVCICLASGCANRLTGPQRHAFSSFDPPRGPVRFDTGTLKLADADVGQLLNLYQEVSARTVIRSPNLPQVKISLQNQTPLTRVETLQLLDTVLAQNGITMVIVGDASVKAVPTYEASDEVPPTIDIGADELPNSSSYMTCTVRLKHAKGLDVVNVLATVSRVPKSIICVPSDNLLILRDYSANIRQMLRLVQQLDRQSPSRAGASKPNTNTAGRRQ